MYPPWFGAQKLSKRNRVSTPNHVWSMAAAPCTMITSTPTKQATESSGSKYFLTEEEGSNWQKQHLGGSQQLRVLHHRQCSQLPHRFKVPRFARVVISCLNAVLTIHEPSIGQQDAMSKSVSILWMDEILHHARNHGLMIPLQIPTTLMVSTHGFQVVRNGFRNHPQVQFVGLHLSCAMANTQELDQLSDLQQEIAIGVMREAIVSLHDIHQDFLTELRFKQQWLLTLWNPTAG